MAAITGAGAGMGLSLAVLLARAGCHVTISDLNADGQEETRAMLDPTINVPVHVVDVAPIANRRRLSPLQLTQQDQHDL